MPTSVWERLSLRLLDHNMPCRAKRVRLITSPLGRGHVYRGLLISCTKMRFKYADIDEGNVSGLDEYFRLNLVSPEGDN
mgnify:CR=1 FL=1